MILLSVNQVSKHYGPDPVLDGVTFDLRAGQRAALVGPNGAGKTTLLKILGGYEEADSGTLQLRESAKIGYLEQHPCFHPRETVWSVAQQALADLIELGQRAEQVAAQIAAAEDVATRKRHGAHFDRLQQELHRRDGYHLEHKIQRVLAGLGLEESCFRQPVVQLSGGQQNRLLLAKLLLEEPDLLLLDEPSNHLDIAATQWLEQFLAASRQALIVVSHDRYFLDKVANCTLELVHGSVESYPGNFTAYRRQKAERLEVQRRTYARQQAEIAKLEEFVRRHHYGQKHAQAEDRRKKLERIERVPPPREISAPPMGFPPARRSGDIVLRVEHLGKGFDRPLFGDLTFDVLRGQKWGLLGPNGSGKTTLLRCLLGQLQPDEGRAVMGAQVKVGYFDQLLQCLTSEATVIEAVRPDHKEFVEQQRRDLLARFGVTGDMAFQAVHSLSGGERSRAALAMLAASDANLLVLDEPTNHLDLWARDALEKSLRCFQGTALFVSHDRYFINQVADHLLVVEPEGRFRVVEGNYDTYLHLLRQGMASTAHSQNVQPTPSVKSKRDKPKKSQPTRRRKFPYRKVTDLENDIDACECRIEQLHQALTSPDVLRDGQKVKQIKAELDQQQQQLRQLYQHWEEASEFN